MSYTALAAVQAYHDWDFPAAEATLRQGLEASPGSVVAHARLALLIAATGRLEEAIAEAEWARDLEPLVPERYSNLGIICYYARDFDRALEEMRRALTISTNYGPALFGSGESLWPWADTMTRSRTSDRRLDPHLSRTIPRGWPASRWCTDGAGRTEEAQTVLAQLRDLQAKGIFISVDNFAYIAANLGRFDDVFSELDEAVQRRMTSVLWLSVDPRADALRADPRFARTIARMGIQGR